MAYVTTVEDKTFTIEIGEDGKLVVDGTPHTVDLRHIEPLSLYSLLVDNMSHETFIEKQAGTYQVMVRGKLYNVTVEDKSTWEATSRSEEPITGGELTIEAPLPGVVVKVPVEVGQAVAASEVLVVLESMKMENRLNSPRDGEVKAIHVAANDQVERGEVLVTLAT